MGREMRRELSVGLMVTLAQTKGKEAQGEPTRSINGIEVV